MSVKFSKASVFMGNVGTPLEASDVVATVGLHWIPMSKTAQVILSDGEDLKSQSFSSEKFAWRNFLMFFLSCILQKMMCCFIWPKDDDKLVLYYTLSFCTCIQLKLIKHLMCFSTRSECVCVCKFSQILTSARSLLMSVVMAHVWTHWAVSNATVSPATRVD